MFRKLIQGEIAKLAPEGTNFSVEAAENPEHGDYASNVAMALAKSLGKNPKEVAEDLKEKLLSNRAAKWIEKIEIAGPGFLNFFISKDSLASSLQDILKDEKKWGTSDVGKNKKVIVEYFQLNIAKRPHIGHIRSAVIGDAIKRMLLAFGYNAISDTHVGDWGTQFGILLLAWKESGRSPAELKTGDPFSILEDLYIAENERMEKEPERRERAKEEFAELERGDKENRKIWEQMVSVSIKKLEDSVDRLGILKFDEHKGESSYEKDMPAIVDLALEKGVALKEDGAVLVNLEKEGLDKAILIKSDGASTYLLRDLATIKYRKAEYNFYKNLYLVDVRQEHHFKQVFKVAELLGFEGVGESEHVSYGFMSLPEGAISTRKGQTISLDDVLNEAETRALKTIEEKNSELKNKEEVAKMVGLGALKYFDLSHNRHSDIVFKWDEALSFEGNTGPYVQYTHARLKSILRKAGHGGGKINENIEMDKTERELVVLLSRFPEAIEDALSVYMPNLLANYLFQLAQKANEFYHSHPVMQEADESKKQFKLSLIGAISLILKKGLYLLGIDSPEEM